MNMLFNTTFWCFSDLEFSRMLFICFCNQINFVAKSAQVRLSFSKLIWCVCVIWSWWLLCLCVNACSDADARVERRLQQHHPGRRAPAASATAAAAVFGRFGHPSAFAAGDGRQLLRDGGDDAEAAPPPGRPTGLVPAVGKPASPCGPRVHQQQRISGQPHHLPGRVRAAGSDG